MKREEKQEREERREEARKRKERREGKERERVCETATARSHCFQMLGGCGGDRRGKATRSSQELPNSLWAYARMGRNPEERVLDARAEMNARECSSL